MKKIVLLFAVVATTLLSIPNVCHAQTTTDSTTVTPVTIFPNPVYSQFTISCEGDWTCEIRDITGTLLIPVFTGSNAQNFQRGNIPPGPAWFRIIRGASYKPHIIIQQILFN